MLNLMRKHARHWLMLVVLGIIILVFVLYFGSTRWEKMAEAIATVDGKPISYRDLEKEYQDLIDFYKQRYGGAMTEEMMKGLNLKQQAFDSLIQRDIILRKAVELKLEATDEEVRASILADPTFQRDGVFDEKVYHQVLRYHKMTPSDFESAQKKNMAIVRMEALLRDGVKVSDAEVFDLYRVQNEKVNANLFVLSAKDFEKGVRQDRKALEAYLTEHQSDFRVPEKFQIKYISFAAHDFSASVKISDAEIQDYYDRHKDQFMKKGGKAISLSEAKGKIIAELKQMQGMYNAADEAKKAHDTIYQKENFDEYARQKGLKVVVTDFFSVKNPPDAFWAVKDFTKTVQELQKDDISPILSDNQRYYLFKIAAKSPAHTAALGDIEGEVQRKYLAGESARLCKKEAESILERLKKGVPLQQASSGGKLAVSETGFFQIGKPIPKIGASKELNEALFAISESNPYTDRPYYVDGKYVIVKFKERAKLDNTNYVAQKESLKNLLFNIKRDECVRSWMDQQKTSMMKTGKLKLLKDVKDL